MKNLLSVLMLMTLYVCAHSQNISLPSNIVDSIIFRLDRSLICDSLQFAQQEEIKGYQELLQATGKKILLQGDEIAQWEVKEGLWQLQFENQAKITGVEKSLLKTRLKSLRRWLTVSVAGNVILVVILVAL